MATRYEENVREAMEVRENVRNMSVIAHVDHGKTTLTDSLLSRAGLIGAGQAGGKLATDTRADEQQRGITIKSTGVSLLYEAGDEVVSRLPAEVRTESSGRHGYVVNLIDCPGHVDFSSEVTAALRLTDGAMVVVDCVSGVCVQTETVLRQAVTERIKPVLMMNKLDRCILEKQMDLEDLFLSLQRTINKVNAVVSTYADESCPMGDLTLDPTLGNVAFGSGRDGWGFTVPQMAAIYSKRLGVNEKKMTRRLWGEHYYNPETNKWGTKPAPGYTRAFNKFVLEPLYKILNATLKCERDEVSRLCERLSVQLSSEEKELAGKELMRLVMRRWLPAGDAMFEIIIGHLPSPAVAQVYRADILYEGPLDDEAAQGIRTCNRDGPLMMYISKMVPSPNDKGRFLAFGRVFSGVATSGQKVRIMGPNYVPNTCSETGSASGGGKKNDLHIQPLQRVLVMMGATSYSAGSVPCGNICALSGVDKFLLKTGTISTYENAHNMRVLKFSVSPVVRAAVDIVNPVDLPKLVEGLRRLAKSDPMVQVTHDSGQHIVAGAGELHLQVCLDDLENEHAGVPLKRSEPVVSYMETVTLAGSQPVLVKSPNKHNRLFMTASPLPEGLSEDIEQGKVNPEQDVKERSRYLSDTYDLDPNESRRLWCFGPDGRGENMLIDTSVSVQNMMDIKDSVKAGFQWATSEGPLCEERMRGVRVSLTDAMVHRDPACRKTGMMTLTARRAVLAACQAARPALLEPIFLVEIQCPEKALGGVHSAVGMRRGQVFDEAQQEGTPLFVVKAYMPVNESFGFTEALRSSTGGQAFPTLVFDHWQQVPGDPYDVNTRAGAIVREVRIRKGLNPTIPTFE